MADQNPQLQEKLAELDHELEVCCAHRVRCLFRLITAFADISIIVQEGDITKKGYDRYPFPKPKRDSIRFLYGKVTLR